jgi:hypothetical protein
MMPPKPQHIQTDLIGQFNLFQKITDMFGWAYLVSCT